MIPLKDDNPSSKTPYVTIALIVLNVAVFAYQLTLSELDYKFFILNTSAIPFEISSMQDIVPGGFLPPPFTLLSSLFVHADILHLIGNMLFLWIFGDNVEDTLGHVLMLGFYLLAGTVASLTHILIHPNSIIPLIGASGAISGILGAYLILFPRARILTLIFLFVFVHYVRIPAVAFILIWFAFQVLSAGNGDNIAWYAHIGGFGTGVLIFGLLRIRTIGKKRE